MVDLLHYGEFIFPFLKLDEARALLTVSKRERSCALRHLQIEYDLLKAIFKEAVKHHAIEMAIPIVMRNWKSRKINSFFITFSGQNAPAPILRSFLNRGDLKVESLSYAFERAALRGDLLLAQALVDKGAGLIEKELDALTFSTIKNHSEITRLALSLLGDSPVRIEIIANIIAHDDLPSFLQLKKISNEIIKKIGWQFQSELILNEKPELKPTRELSSFFRACIKGDLAAVQETRSYHMIQNDLAGGFKVAAKFGQLEVVRELFERVTISTSGALADACLYGHQDVVSFLLQDNRIKESERKRAFRLAVIGGHLPIVEEMLLDPSIDPTEERYDVLKIAAKNNHFHLINTLLQHNKIRSGKQKVSDYFYREGSPKKEYWSLLNKIERLPDPIRMPPQKRRKLR